MQAAIPKTIYGSQASITCIFQTCQLLAGGRVGSQAVRSLDNIEDVSDELSNHSGNAATDMSDAKENIPGGQDLKSAHQHQTVSESRSSAAQADQNDGKKVR